MLHKAVLALSLLMSPSAFAEENSFWQLPSSSPDHYWQVPFDQSKAYEANMIKSHLYVQKESLNTILKIDFDDFREVPDLFKSYLPGENFDRPRKVSIYLALTNDYNVLSPVGVEAETDDNGYTHGSKIVIGGFLPQGHYMSFEYSSDLYTQPIDGTAYKLPDGGRYVSQHFTNENVLKIVLDNIDKNRGKTFYWKAEAGWQQLKSDSPGGYLEGATQQAKFHALINKAQNGKMKTPINVDNGKDTRNGAILGLYVGIAKEYLMAKNMCRVRAFAESGGRGSTINEASYVAANVGGILWCQSSPSSLTYRAELGHESKLYNTGYEGTGYADISTGKNNWRIGFRIMQKHGKLLNYVDYNLKNIKTNKIDMIFMLYFRYDFR
ncbi:hypothetical protein AZI87_01415 [Bdellovibrio bacteriovorus]|uniref:Uncharacterized protein n=1 Tax=Bdellovibrio bacteriovorus TaxID=959 RepID=A0A162GEK7_BDEBC|nr:hypothetical protein [Bdellovibrio bacteriovorus]KYG67961.1 hypothetical protein AZI87_01415 [Bdellovibrio bacteriovorus]